MILGIGAFLLVPACIKDARAPAMPTTRLDGAIAALQALLPRL
jgi:hypothetical protein